MSHHKFSPSSMKQIIACPGSVNAQKYVKNVSNDFADEGTVAHWVMAHMLDAWKRGVTLSNGDIIGVDLDKVDEMNVDNPSRWLNDEMVNHVRKMVDLVVERCVELDGYLHIEVRVDLTDYFADGYGTADVIIIADGKLVVMDLKYGKGVQVDAVRNEQLMTYALGAFSMYDHLYGFDEIELWILQPRLHHVDSYTCGVEELEAFGRTVVQAIELAERHDAPRNPGAAQCKFCRARGFCTPLALAVKAGMENAHEIRDLGDAELAALMPTADLARTWATGIEAEVFDRLRSGKQVPNWKLVRGRSIRRWGNEDEAIDGLKNYGLADDDLFEKKLTSVAKIEKLLGRKKFKDLSDLVVKPDGKPTLVPASDKRPEITVGEAVGFDDIT